MVKRIIIRRPARPRVVFRPRPKYIIRHRSTNEVKWGDIPMFLRIIMILLFIGILIGIINDIVKNKRKKNKRRLNNEDENIEIIINERNNWWNNW